MKTKTEIDNVYKTMIIRDFMTFHKKTRDFSISKEKGFQKKLLKNFNYNSISKMSTQQGIDLGVINIHRPLLPENILKKIKESELHTQINDFNKFKNNELDKIIENYSKFNIDFNIKNVEKYGFLRADPNHPSEKILEKRKPEKIFNLPKYHSNLEKKVELMFPENSTFNNKKDNKNKKKITI